MHRGELVGEDVGDARVDRGAAADQRNPTSQQVVDRIGGRNIQQRRSIPPGRMASSSIMFGSCPSITGIRSSAFMLSRRCHYMVPV